MPGCLRCLTSEADLGPRPPGGVCARCGHRWALRPFFAVSGATGVGKSTVGARLPALGFVALDGDLLWRHEYWSPPADPGVHEARLRRRDPGAAAHDPHFADYLACNEWLRVNGPTLHPPMTVLDTTDATPDATTAAVADWIRDRLPR